MSTFATLFSGGELAGIGLQSSGYTHLWGIEQDKRIASVANDNGFTVLVDDVLTTSPTTLPTPYWLHASPPCVRATTLIGKAKESTLDIEIANAVCKYITELNPTIVTIENVPRYKTFESYKQILATLHAQYQYVDSRIITMGNYNVPTIRKRVIVLASHNPIRYPEESKERTSPLDVVSFDDMVIVETYTKKLAFVVSHTDSSVPTLINIGTTFIDYAKGTYLVRTSVNSDIMYYIYQGKAYKLGIRTHARLMTIPDWYTFNCSDSLARKIIGNGVPCKFMELLGKENLWQ